MKKKIAKQIVYSLLSVILCISWQAVSIADSNVGKGYIDVEFVPFPIGIDKADSIFHSLSQNADKIYIGTCKHGGLGNYAHLLVYNPDTGRIEDLGDMQRSLHEWDNYREPQGKIHTELWEAKDGKIYGGTHRANWYQYVTEYDPTGYPGGHWFRYNPMTKSIEDLGIPFAHEGIITVTMDVSRNKVYGITFPKGILLVLDVKTLTTKVIGRVDPNSVRSLVVYPDGKVYGTSQKGFIWEYDPQTQRVNNLWVRMPRVMGYAKSRGSGWTKAVLGPESGKIYAVTGRTAHLIEYNPRQGKYGEVKDLGRVGGESSPTAWSSPNTYTNTLILAHDKNLYYTIGGSRLHAGDAGRISATHLRRYNLRKGRFEDLGAMRVSKKPLLLVEGCAASAVGNDGTLYFAGYVEGKKYKKLGLIIIKKEELR